MKRRLLITFLLGCLLPFAVQAQHGTFRFAQITDIHFSPNNPNPTEDLQPQPDGRLTTFRRANKCDRQYRLCFGYGRHHRRGRPCHYAESQRDIGFTESEVLRDPR